MQVFADGLNGVAGGALEPNRRVMLNGSGKLVVAGADDNDLGTTNGRAYADGDSVSITPANASGAVRMVSAGNVTRGDRVYGAANGTVSTTPNGNYLGVAWDTVTGAGSFVTVVRDVSVDAPGDIGGEVVFDDDFLTVFPAAASAITLPSPWAKRETNGDGVTTVAPHQVKLSFDDTTEAAAAALFWGLAHVHLDSGPIFEARVSLVDEGDAAAATFRFGLASGDNATFASIAQYAVFEIAGGTRDIKVTSKDGTTTVAAVDTTVDFAEGFVNFRIDATDKTDVKFFVGGVRVLAATVFALDANASVMPLFWVAKTSNDTEGDLRVDRVRVIAQR